MLAKLKLKLAMLKLKKACRPLVKEIDTGPVKAGNHPFLAEAGDAIVSTAAMFVLVCILGSIFSKRAQADAERTQCERKL